MPLIETRGAGSAQGFGEFAQSAAVNYIEDVFSTYLYTGNQTARSIVNGIDLSTKGGMIWTKCRSAAGANAIYDTARGTTGQLNSGSTAAAGTATDAVTAYNTDGYSLGVDNVNGNVNNNGFTFVSWTFRKQAKFFDVVTFTSNGSGGGTFSHSLGSTPGCVIIKSTSAANSWLVYHRSTGVSKYLELQSTAAEQTGTNWISVSSTSVTVDSGWLGNNRSMVAYLFAHDAGGFGLSGTDNVISCGSFTTNGSGVIPTVTLGYEPQWVLIKETSGTNSWFVFDNMRQMSMTNAAYLNPNSSGAEALFGYGVIAPTATGFVGQSGSPAWNPSATFIYIAIRRGPMKVPTSGTSVFYPQVIAQADTIDSTGVPFPPDLVTTFSSNGTNRTNLYMSFQMVDRLRSLGTPSNTFSTSTDGLGLNTTSSSAENTETSYVQLKADSQNITRGSGWNASNYGNWIDYFFRRAPGFFDVVCYTGNDVARTVSHNLGAVPELIIVKARNNGTGWCCYAASLGNTTRIYLNQTGSATSGVSSWNSTTPTSSVFSLLGPGDVNQSGYNYVAYLFATVAGVSKVGTYTGNGSNQTINCGFTGGSRFVLIKRTDSTGDWYVWDSARGIVSGNDPHLSLNTTAAEVTTDDSVDTDSTGFIVNQLAATNINVSSASYIFLAVA